MNQRYFVVIALLWIGISGIQAQPMNNDSSGSKEEAILANKLYNESLELYQDQKIIEGIGMLNKAVRLRPDFAQAYYNRGIMNIALKNYQDALADIDQALLLDQTSEFLSAKGYLYLMMEDYQKAYETLTLAINEDNENAEAHYYRGCALAAMNRNSTAITDFDRAIEIKPDYALAYNERGRQHFMNKEYENAKTDLTRAVTFDQTLAVGYNNLGKVLEQMDDFEAATEYYTTALRINRDFAEAYHNRGKINYKAGKYEEAIADLQRTIELDPENAAACNDLGMAKYMSSDLNGSVASFSEAINLSSDYATAWLNRGIVREMLRDTKGACKDWIKASDLGNREAMNYINNQCQ